MNKVIVKSGGNIQGSLISDNVTINEKCDMKDCIVGMGKRVEAEGNYNQTININCAGNELSYDWLKTIL